jgi:hypothetical protein
MKNKETSSKILHELKENIQDDTQTMAVTCTLLLEYTTMYLKMKPDSKELWIILLTLKAQWLLYVPPVLTQQNSAF